MRPTYEYYPSSFWGGCLFIVHRRKTGLAREDAIARSIWLRSEMANTFTLAIITSHGLDNPYMTEHARLTLMADARRTGLAGLARHSASGGDA